jgi:hypothetical protein
VLEDKMAKLVLKVNRVSQAKMVVMAKTALKAYKELMEPQVL